MAERIISQCRFNGVGTARRLMGFELFFAPGGESWRQYRGSVIAADGLAHEEAVATAPPHSGNVVRVICGLGCCGRSGFGFLGAFTLAAGSVINLSEGRRREHQCGS